MRWGHGRVRLSNRWYYVPHTDLTTEQSDVAATLRSYNSVAQVERAFRCLKTIDLQLRPIFHWNADRVRAHVFLCMLALYVEHHLRRKLAPILYEETAHEDAAKARASIVAKAQRSQTAKDKDAAKKTPDGLPVHSLPTLIADLATLARIEAVTAVNENHVFTIYTRPTPLQSRAFELLGIKPERTQ